MTAGTLYQRKVHARAICDGCSVCARPINKPGLGGVPDGRSKPKGNHGVASLKLHSDEPTRNCRNETLESPASEKPKFW